jgi:glucan phosphoethanolaminetransferase (alkaline phosphatase superfamily)
MASRLPLASLFCLVVVATAVALGRLVEDVIDLRPVAVEFDAAVESFDGDAVGQVFVDTGAGLSEEASVRFAYERPFDGRFHHYRLVLPVRQAIDSIRFDPWDRGTGSLTLRRFRVNRHTASPIEMSDRARVWQPRNTIEVVAFDAGTETVRITTTGEDPQLVVADNLRPLTGTRLQNALQYFGAVWAAVGLIAIAALSTTVAAWMTGTMRRRKSIEVDAASPLVATAVLMAIDLIVRGWDPGIDPGVRAAGVALVLVQWFAIFALLASLQGRILGVVIRLLLSAGLAAVFFFEYLHFHIYRLFVTDQSLSTLIVDFDFWSHNFTRLFATSNGFLRFGFVAFLLTFVVLLFGVAAAVRGAGLARATRVRMAPVTWLVVVAALAGLFRLAATSDAVQALLPDLAAVRVVYDIRATLVDNIFGPGGPGRHVRLAPTQIVTRDSVRHQERAAVNILLIVNESLRQNHLGTFGYARDTDPHIRAFGQDAWRFSHAVSNSAITTYSVESLFTGRNVRPADPVTADAPLIWPYLKAAGYFTFYIGSHSASWSKGFGRYLLDEDQIDLLSIPIINNAAFGRDDAESVDSLLAQLPRMRRSEQPFFGVLHTNGSHYPYSGAPETDLFLPAAPNFDPSRIQESINQYDNSLRYLDHQLGRVFSALRTEGLLDNTVVIFTADHGEAFYEHQEYFHGSVLWQETVQVPLFVRMPPRVAALLHPDERQALADNTGAIVANVDLLPTIMDFIGIPGPPETVGASLLRAPAPRTILAQADGSRMAVFDTGSWTKYLVDNALGRVQAFDLRADPAERRPTNLAWKVPVGYGDLVEAIASARWPDRVAWRTPHDALAPSATR